MDAGRQTLIEFEVSRTRFEPGDLVTGRVLDGRGVVAVDLVRVESSPAATLEFSVASAGPDADGTFQLTVPADAPPSITGKRCALVWRLRARMGIYPQHADARTTLEITCPA